MAGTGQQLVAVVVIRRYQRVAGHVPTGDAGEDKQREDDQLPACSHRTFSLAMARPLQWPTAVDRSPAAGLPLRSRAAPRYPCSTS
jgi:hypothetical protein